MLKQLTRILLLLFTVCTVSSAQQGSGIISGFVYDKSNGEALIGANIFIKETGSGASTNISGYFVIPNVKYGKYTISFSYIGYKTEIKNIEVNSGSKNEYTINLQPEALETQEIVVSADSVRTIDKLYTRPVSKIEMTPTQVNLVPRIIEADLLRALQTMPGITALSDFSSALYVRGGTPDQNLYMIDGTDVYNPEHAFGIFSTFNTNAIKKVEVSKGGFGAEYGGRLSSVLNVTNLDGNRNNFEGVVNLSLLSASTTLQMPLGSIGSISGSLRRTFIEATYAKWIDEVPDYYFYDGNVKAFLDLGEKDKLSISYFNGRDDLDFKLDKDAPQSFGFLYDWGNTTGSINWRHIFNPQLFASFWLTGSRFESNFRLDQIMRLRERNYLSDYTFKAALEYYSSSNFNLKFGAEQKLLHFLYKQDWDKGLIDINNHRQMTVSYLSGNWKPNADWDVEAGVRANYFNSGKEYFNLDPRLSVKYGLTELSNLKLAAGGFHQYLNRIPRLFFNAIWTSADENFKPSSSKHLILSYQREIASAFEFEVEAYYKDYKDIYIFNPVFTADVRPDAYSENGNPIYRSADNLYVRGDGKSYGLEFLLRKDVGAFSGWVSYSLSQTKNTFDGINQNKEYIPRHDRASVVNLVLNTDFTSLFKGRWNEPAERGSSRWLLSINFIYATGQPITVPASAYYSNTVPDWDDVIVSGERLPGYNLYPGEINSVRLPDYIRMDMSFTYEKDFGSWMISPYLQVYNIGSRQNTWFITYSEELKDGALTQKIEKVNMLPLLPSIGLTIKF